jgi:succinoglycan biosynthesis protein ExoM
MIDLSITTVDVLICTYRRPALLGMALDGIERAAAKLANVRIVVVDNDELLSAREVVQKWAARASVDVIYLTQPLQNISLTRNMALDHATAEWVAMIDDDEVPDENWLSAMIDTAGRFGADVVFAPVISRFDDDAPGWAKNSRLFHRKRFATGTTIPLKETRTSNVLLRGARLSVEAFRFDPKLGLSGGEDSEFFARLTRAKFRMVWCDDACVREWTPLSRTTKRWLLKRAFRVGSVEAYNKRRFRQFNACAKELLKALLFIAVGGALAFCLAPLSISHTVFALWRVAFGAGFFYGLVAGPYLEYRSSAASKID